MFCLWRFKSGCGRHLSCGHVQGLVACTKKSLQHLRSSTSWFAAHNRCGRERRGRLWLQEDQARWPSEGGAFVFMCKCLCHSGQESRHELQVQVKEDPSFGCCCRMQQPRSWAANGELHEGCICPRAAQAPRGLVEKGSSLACDPLLWERGSTPLGCGIGALSEHRLVALIRNCLMEVVLPSGVGSPGWVLRGVCCRERVLTERRCLHFSRFFLHWLNTMLGLFSVGRCRVMEIDSEMLRLADRSWCAVLFEIRVTASVQPPVFVGIFLSTTQCAVHRPRFLGGNCAGDVHKRWLLL